MKWTSYLAAAGVAASLAAGSAGMVEAQDTTAAVRQEQADTNHRMHGAERVRGADRMRGAERTRAGRAGPRRMMEQGRMAGPAERLLEQRAELGLSAEQVRRLEAIRDSYSEKNKPYVEELTKLRETRRAARAATPRAGAPRAADSGAVKRRPAEPRSAEARAAMDALRANHEAARKEASAVLTEAQRKLVQEKMNERRERRAN